MEAGGQGAGTADDELVFAVRRDPVRDGSIFGRHRSNAVAPTASPACATPQAALCASQPRVSST